MTHQHHYSVTCQRCGKTMAINQNCDGIHTCTPKDHQTSEEAVSFEVCGEVVKVDDNDIDAIKRPGNVV